MPSAKGFASVGETAQDPIIAGQFVDPQIFARSVPVKITDVEPQAVAEPMSDPAIAIDLHTMAEAFAEAQRPADTIIALVEDQPAIKQPYVSLLSLREKQKTAVFREDKVKLNLELWAQFYDDRRQENPVDFLLCAIEKTPSLWVTIDKEMTRWEMKAKNFEYDPACSYIPAPDYGRQDDFRALVDKIAGMQEPDLATELGSCRVAAPAHFTL